MSRLIMASFLGHDCSQRYQGSPSVTLSPTLNQLRLVDSLSRWLRFTVAYQGPNEGQAAGFRVSGFREAAGAKSPDGTKLEKPAGLTAVRERD